MEDAKTEDRGREEQHKAPTAEEMQDMQTVRVIQKNLVYVIGLPLEVSSEATIRRKDMFGQYGHLSKIVVNNRNPICDKSSTCGVYLTYDTNEQALECIKCVDGFTLCGKLLKWASLSLPHTQSELRHHQVLLQLHKGTEVHQPRLPVPAPPRQQGGLLHEGGDEHATGRVLPDDAPRRRLAVGRAPAALRVQEGERGVRDDAAATTVSRAAPGSSEEG